jgi:hypothetical protein
MFVVLQILVIRIVKNKDILHIILYYKKIKNKTINKTSIKKNFF